MSNQFVSKSSLPVESSQIAIEEIKMQLPKDFLSSFSPSNVLRFDGQGKFVVLQGVIPDVDGTNKPALLQFEQRAACESQTSFVENLPNFALQLTNYSGAEYSNYYGTGLGASWNVEVIWPASERQILRKTPSKHYLVEESGELYAKYIDAFVKQQNIAWLDSVVNMETEVERNLFHNERFIINIDTKWTTHVQPTDDRKSWYGATWTDDLYLLAIVKNPLLHSLRDLNGEEGAALCDEMRDELRNAAKRVYGVDPSQLRIMFHYHPQFYRLHAHCVRTHSINPGSETERAHLLTTVAYNLRMKSDYYKDATLSYSVREGERLHQLLLDAGQGLV